MLAEGWKEANIRIGALGRRESRAEHQEGAGLVKWPCPLCPLATASPVLAAGISAAEVVCAAGAAVAAVVLVRADGALHQLLCERSTEGPLGGTSVEPLLPGGSPPPSPPPSARLPE